MNNQKGLSLIDLLAAITILFITPGIIYGVLLRSITTMIAQDHRTTSILKKV